MVLTLGALGVALRAGIELRRARLRGDRGRGALLHRHLCWARPAYVALAVGFVGGPLSVWWWRGWTPFTSFHAWAGLSAMVLFTGAAWQGLRLLRGETRAVEIHARLVLGAALCAGLAALSGLVLLP